MFFGVYKECQTL